MTQSIGCHSRSPRSHRRNRARRVSLPALGPGASAPPSLEALEARELLASYQFVPPNFLDVGNSWTYAGTFTTNNGQKANTAFTMAQNIVGTVAVGSQTTLDRRTHLQFASTDIVTDEDLQIGPDSLLLYGSSQVNGSSTQTLTLRDSNPLELLPRVFSGTSTPGAGEFDVTGDNSYQLTDASSVSFAGVQNVTLKLGSNTVTVPAMKVTLSITGTFTGGSSLTQDTYWINPDYGIVKGSHSVKEGKKLITAYSYVLNAFSLANPLAARTVSVADLTVTDPASGSKQALFTVTLSNAIMQPVTLGYYTSAGTAKSGQDYQSATNGSVTIPAGQLTAAIPVTIYADSSGTAGETFSLMLDGAVNASISDGKATCTINNPPNVTIAAAASTITETAGATDSTIFTVTSDTAAPAGGMVVKLAFAGTAKIGKHYTLAGLTKNSLTIPAGSTTATFTVTSVNDHKASGDLIAVATVQGTAVYNPGSTKSVGVTILDAEPKVTIASEDDEITEAAGNAHSTDFTVTSSSAAPAGGLLVSLNFSGHGKLNKDYSLSGVTRDTVLIPAGDTSATFTMTAINNNKATGNLDVLAAVKPAKTYNVGAPGTTTLSIIDAAPAMHISVGATSLTEVAGVNHSVIVTITSDVAPTSDMRVYFTLGGTAKVTQQYGLAFPAGGGQSNYVIMKAGATTATFTLTALDDHANKGNQTISFSLHSGAGYNIGTPSSQTIVLLDAPAAG